ncbi:MAG: hypothetical protein WCH60_06010 [Burkholderiales bacterium]
MTDQTIERYQSMHKDLKEFVQGYSRVVIMALIPIVMTAFLSVPYMLGGHPGDVRTVASAADFHMT